MSYYYAKFKENPCVGTDESTPFEKFIILKQLPKVKHQNCCKGYQQTIKVTASKERVNGQSSVMYERSTPSVNR